MALAVWQGTITDDEGNIQSGASVEVRKEVSGSPLATLYQDRNGATGESNPVIADGEGFVRFYTEAGAYKITATKGALTKTWRHVAIGTAAEVDTAIPVASGGTGASDAATAFGNLSGIHDLREYGAVGDGTTDDTTAVQAAIDAKVPLLVRGTFKLTSSIVFPADWSGALIGLGRAQSQFTLAGAITGLDLTDTTAKNGVILRDFSIVGDSTSGQIGIDCFYLTNSTVIENILIDTCDIGMRIEKVFFAKISNIRIRDCATYGMEINAPSSANQVNGIALVGIFIRGGVNCINAAVANNCYALSLIGCTLEQSEQTAFVAQNCPGLSLIGCYFEGNFRDGTAISPQTVLGATDAIDIKITDNGGVPRPVTISGCHFNTSSGWASSSDKQAVYLGQNVAAAIIGNSYISGGSGTLDYWFRFHTGALRPLMGANNGSGEPTQNHDAPIPALANSATPSLHTDPYTKFWRTGGTTTITDFLLGNTGQEITILAEHTITITDGTNIFLNGSANFNMVSGDTLTLVQKADGLWYETARSVN